MATRRNRVHSYQVRPPFAPASQLVIYVYLYIYTYTDFFVNFETMLNSKTPKNYKVRPPFAPAVGLAGSGCYAWDGLCWLVGLFLLGVR